MNSRTGTLLFAKNLTIVQIVAGAMIAFVALVVPGVAHGQADFEKGYQAYQSYHGTDFDTVNLANGNLVLNIPLLSYEQRGNLPPVVISIRSNSTTFQSAPPFSSGPPDTQQHEVPSGVSGSPAGQPHVVISPGGLYWKEERITLQNAQLSRFVAVDDSGATHSLGQNIANSSAPYIGNIHYSVDGSDLMLTATTQPLIVDRKGNIGGLKDVNGNAITLQGSCATPAGSGQFYNAALAPWEGYANGTASATTITDSIGRVIPNPAYVPPVASYNCIVDTDQAYYPAVTTINNSSCPAAQIFNATTQEAGVAASSTGAPDMASETWNFPSQNGSTVALTFCYQKINVYLILPNVGRTTTTFNEVWPVLTGVILPNNTQWGFVYDYWGQVMSVTTPTGAKTSYAYNYGNSTGTQATRLACGNPPGEIPVSGVAVWPTTNLMSSRMVTQRTVTIPNPDGTTSTEQWNYASTIGSGWVGSPNQGQVTVTDSMGNDTLHQFTLIGTAALGQPICGPYETSATYYQGKVSGGIALKNVSTSYTSVGVDHANPTNFSNYIALGVLPQTVTTTLYKPGGSQSQTSVNTFDTFGTYQDYKGTTYPFTFGEKLKLTESDWGSATPVRTTLLTNQWQSNWGYWAANMMDLPCLTTVLSGQTTATQPSCTAGPPPSSQAAQASYAYDQSPSPSGARGNLTSMTRWLNLGSSPVSKTTYNAYGMPIYKYDPLGNPTQIVYDMNGLGIYPFEIIHPPTGSGSVQHTEYFQYDDATGELLSHTDENNNITHFYYDPMRRLTQTTYSDGGSEAFTYTDSAPPSFTFSKVLNSSSATFSEAGYADGLGRKYQTKVTSDAEGIISADTRYDALGRLLSQSNPYRSPTESTYGVTSFTYDALGRKTIQTQQDGSKQQWCYMGLATTSQTNCHSQLSSSTTGSFVDFMDESGNDWQRNSDGLGRLTSVMEPNGAATTPSMQTTHTYDVLGDLLSVAQTGNTGESPRGARSFNYDSLSRLMCVSNPENSSAACPAAASNSYTAGTTAYAYDADGNLLTHTQPLVNASSGSQAINYCYDQLNRKAAEYTGSLVANCTSWSQVSVGNRLSAYTYDTSSISGTANAVGHLTDEIEYTAGTSVWERSPYKFDTMGRLTSEQQCAFGTCTAPYPFTYAYDYAGNLTSTTNGVTSVSPITISYTYDAVARLATVTSVTPTTGIWAGTNFPSTLYTAKEYGSAGILSATYGTKPNYLSRLYDNRLRTTNSTIASASTQATGMITLACIQTGCTASSGMSVTAVIGGVTVTVTAGANGTALSSLAASVVTAINTTDGMLVSASTTSGSSVVNLTATEYGKDGEVSLSTSASSGATFTSTASGLNLGGDTSTIPYSYALTYAANSNVATANDGTMGNWTYNYDTLNRLVSSNATTGGIVISSVTYKTQCWYYDGFGNRTGEGENTSNTACASSVTGNPRSSWATYNTSNRLTANSMVANFLYDDAGNTVNDGINKYVYDLDGRICAVTTAAGGGAITQYVYDAEGRRVAKGTLTTWPAAGQVCPAPTSANGFTATAMYLRGGHGDQDTELNGSGVWQHTNVFTGGGLTATYNTGTSATFTFSFSDWLGSKRVQTNANGGVQIKWTSDPFGDYLNPSSTTYADATEHHFTGKERDTESGNDYFGARYYESGIGRWVSPDWSSKMEPVPYSKLDTPQTLNLYSYVQNRPLSHFDNDGHDTILMIWKKGGDSAGHSAIAVSNYKRVTVHENGKTVTKMVPDGTYSYRDLWPSKGVGKSNFDKDVLGTYQKLTASSLDKLKTTDVSVNEGRLPDGVLRLSSGYETDQATLKKLDDYATAHPNYNGVNNNCTTYANQGIDFATGQEVDGTEHIKSPVLWLKDQTADTPNHLWNATAKLPGAEVLKDPGDTSKPYIEGIF